MKNNKYLLINISVMLFVLYAFVYGQGKESLKNNSLQKIPTTNFQKYNGECFKQKTTDNYFPNSTGDFWEFIATDTTTLLGALYSNLKFSVTREVLNDTLLNNGRSYKIVKWNNEANSVSYLPQYEYQRVDTAGNVYLLYNSADHILFDFSKQIGETYPAHLTNHYWQVTDRYMVIGFGDTLQAIDFVLYDQGSIIKEKYSIAENFGVFFYKKNWDFPLSPGCDNWGAVINGQVYGTLIVKKQTVDWKEFYPLHIGDYWVYQGFYGNMSTLSSVRVIGDTLMPDGNTYFISRLINYNYADTLLNYRRLDSLGRVFYWEWWNSNSIIYIKLNVTVGDTSQHPLSSDLFWRNDDKYINQDYGKEDLHYFAYPDLTFISENYTYNIGLSQWTSEQTVQTLKGAYVNNTYYGDTTLTNIGEEINPSISNYKLFQNYPNPFNSSTIISFHLPNSTLTELSIYNILGEKIKTLINEFLVTGLHTIKFYKNDLPSGIYIYVLKTDEIQLSGKMIYLR